MKVTTGILVVALISAGAFFVYVKIDSGSTTTQQVSENNTSASSETAVEYTVEEVAKHNQAGDCWTIIENKVYNITAYIPRHPGGDEILRACGNDATSLFASRTTDQGEKVGSGSPHSGLAESQLAQFYLADLSR